MFIGHAISYKYLHQIVHRNETQSSCELFYSRLLVYHIAEIQIIAPHSTTYLKRILNELSDSRVFIGHVTSSEYLLLIAENILV